MVGLNKSLLMIFSLFCRKVGSAQRQKLTMQVFVCAHIAAAIYIANAINGPPIAASDASLFTEPKKVSEAIASTTPDRLQWQQAIQKEYNTLANKMKCWDVVDQFTLPPGSNIIDTTVAHPGIGTGLFDASKRVPTVSFATQGGKQASSYFRQRNWVQAREAQIRFPAGGLEFDSIK